MQKFQTGQTYRVRSSCDWDCVFPFTVESRTAKFMVVNDGYDSRRVGIKTDERGEWALPQGNYSMAPVMRAEHAGVTA